MVKQLVLFTLYLCGLIAAIVLVPAARPALIFGLVLGLTFAGLTTLYAARYRLPNEGWWHWFMRVMSPARKGWERYYCLLACEHNAQIRSSRQPRRDDVAWCPAHSRTHAEQTRVVLVNTENAPGVRTVTGVVLDDDLLPYFLIGGEDA